MRSNLYELRSIRLPKSTLVLLSVIIMDHVNQIKLNNTKCK